MYFLSESLILLRVNNITCSLLLIADEFIEKCLWPSTSHLNSYIFVCVDAVESWRIQKLKEAKKIARGETSNPTIQPAEAGSTIF